MDDSKRLDMNAFKEIISEKQIKINGIRRSFKTKTWDRSRDGITIWTFKQWRKRWKIYIDKEIIIEEIMTFHPNDNTKTLFISTNDLLKYFDSIGYEVNIIEL